jgi:hypothetical protein
MELSELAIMETQPFSKTAIQRAAISNPHQHPHQQANISESNGNYIFLFSFAITSPLHFSF